MFKKTSILLVLSAFFICKSAAGQITIAPIMLFVDDQNRFGTILILNGSGETQEISIDFPFGYPVTDTEGNVQMIYDDSVSADKFGISDVIRGFPQNFILQPGQRQVVRLLVRPGDLEDGMYWTRVKTTSTPQAPPVGETSEGAITAQITYKFEQVTTVFYKHGTVTTGLDIEDLSVNQTGDVVEFIGDVERTGNAPFLGSIILTVSDASGNIVAEKRTSTSVYFDYRQVFRVEKEQLPAGAYTAQFRFVSERPDVSESDIVQTEPVSQSINFMVK